MRPKRTAKSANRPSKTTAAGNQEIARAVQELEETFAAIQRGRVDAVVVNGAQGDQVFTLQGAEHPYRVLVENMNEGAATLDQDGVVLYANSSFAKTLGSQLETLVGTPLRKTFSGA